MIGESRCLFYHFFTVFGINRQIGEHLAKKPMVSAEKTTLTNELRTSKGKKTNMRRKEKEITDKPAMEEIIRQSSVCRLALSDGDMPYVVPLCFGYQDGNIYVHGSLKGKKIEMLRKNQNVCFEFDINTKAVDAEKACDWSMQYQSIIGFGKASFVTDLDEKQKALDVIMGQYSNRAFHFPENKLKGTAVIQIEITSMTGKQSGFEEE